MLTDIDQAYAFPAAQPRVSDLRLAFQRRPARTGQSPQRERFDSLVVRFCDV
jgi:hypothetical protein